MLNPKDLNLTATSLLHRFYDFLVDTSGVKLICAECRNFRFVIDEVFELICTTREPSVYVAALDLSGYDPEMTWHTFRRQDLPLQAHRLERLVSI